MNVVGDTYNATVHCLACTQIDFPRRIARWNTDRDREGNRIHTISSPDKQETTLHCADCNGLIKPLNWK